MQAIAFKLLQKSKKTCDKIKIGGAKRTEISNGLAKQRFALNRIAAELIGREMPCNGMEWCRDDLHREAKDLPGKDLLCNGKAMKGRDRQRNGIARISID